MSSNSLIIIKKHVKNNFKNLFLNFFAMVLSIFALIITLNVISIKNDLHNSILNSFPNKDTYSISKNSSLNLTEGYNITQKTRPTLSELSEIKILENSTFDYDLSFLLDTYELKENNLIENRQIIFEPHFLNTDYFYYSNLELDDFSLEFNKDIKVKTEESEEYENFTWNLNEYEFKKIEVFNFLSVSTIYYPYNLLKNAAESTYFSSIGQNLYEYISNKSSTDIETNYSLVGNIDNKNMENFAKSKYSSLYEITNTPQEITSNFMNLFSSIIDFSFYFLIVIVVFVIVLFLYTVYLIILKNHKEIALLRTYGKSKSSINLIYRFEVLTLFILSFVVSILLSIGFFTLINSLLIPQLKISFAINMNIKLILLLFAASCFLIMLCVQIPLIKVNKINIRKELNSLW